MGMQNGFTIDDERLRLRSFYITRVINKNAFNNFVQVGIWDNNYEYLDLEELKQLRKFINETIIKMTFKNT